MSILLIWTTLHTSTIKNYVGIIAQCTYCCNYFQAFQKLDKEKKKQDLEKMREKYGIGKDK